MVLTHFPPRFRSWLSWFAFIIIVMATGWIPAHFFAVWHWDLTWDKTGIITLTILGMSLGPGLAAIIATVLGQESFRQVLGLKTGKPFFLIPAWLLLPFIALLAAAVSVFFSVTEWDWRLSGSLRSLYQRMPPDAPFPVNHPPNAAALWLIVVLLGPVLFFIPAWLEEIAWRGFLYHRLQKLNFYLIALITGILWWLWRLPLFLQGYVYVDHLLFSLCLSFCFALEISFIITWLRKSSQSILAPTIARATLFSSALIPLTLTDLSDPHWAHLQGITGVILLAVLLIAGAISGVFKTEDPRG